MKENNFQKLMEEDENHYTRLYGDRIRSNLWGTMGFIRLVGEMVTMFVPRVFDVFVMAAGGRGNEAEHQRHYPAPPSQEAGPDPGKIAPAPPPEDAEM